MNINHKSSVAVVILNWNGIDDTVQCIDSLLRQSHRNKKIIVVDNNSRDSSLKVLREIQSDRPDEIVLIENDKNSGFAGGVNIGIHYALKNEFDFVALLNNDAVADPAWLSCLLEAVDKPGVSIATGLLLRRDGKTIDSTGDFFSLWGMPFPRDRNKSFVKKTKSGYVFGATGGASLYRTALFHEIGFFDERFFAYYEDVDMSFRAQLRGHKIYYSSDAIAYHKQGASSDKIPGFAVYQTFKNLPLLFTKNVPLTLIGPIGIRFLLLYKLIFFNAIKDGRGWYAIKGWIMSVWLFWTSSLWLRISIQHHRTAKTSYIKSIIWPDLPPDQTGVRSLLSKFGVKK